jgi:glucose/arabinose dehydrogenase
VYVLPNGDVLVAESNAPPKPEDGKGIKGWFMKKVMGRAGAGAPTANRITLLRDADGDGKAESRSVFLENLNSPFGMAWWATIFTWPTPMRRALSLPAGPDPHHGAPVKVVDLPAGPINHHWTKNIIASADGSKLYVTVGSNSNVAERGMEAETGRAAIWEVDPKTGSTACSPPACAIRTAWAGRRRTGALWTVVNERDEIGSDLVPDYLTSVRDGVFYGWPYSYYGQHVDDRVRPQRPDLVAKAVAPDYALGSHVAPLGLAFSEGKALPGALRDRRVRRRARLLEPRAAQRLQGGVCAFPERPAGGLAGRRADRLPEPRRPCVWAACGCGDGQARRAAGGR